MAINPMLPHTWEMEKTIFISDLDGTLLNSNETVSEYSADIISSFIEQGFLFTYVTARAYSYSRNATSKINFNIPVATYNGAIVINPRDNAVLDFCLIEKMTIKNIAEILYQSSICPMIYSFSEGKEILSCMKFQAIKNNKILDSVISRNNEIKFREVFSIEELLDGDVFYIALTGSKKDILYINSLFKNINGLSSYVQEDVSEKGLYWFEAFSKKVSKKKAAEKLKVYTKTDKIICFGDNINDISMFKIADYSVAMGNAYQKLKQIACDVTTLTNDQDGVAKWLLSNVRNFHSE